jgi:hypothetical protein
MMAMTHALAGLLVGASVLAVAPEYAPAAVAAGLIGGVAPDLDVFWEHRRTLHFPVYLPVVTPLAIVPAIVAQGPATVFLAVFVAAAGVHSLMDIAGGGLGLQPWRRTDDRAVYSHAHGRWLGRRGPIGYDGSPGDLLLAGTMGLPLVAFGDGPVVGLAVVLVLAAAGYTLVRKRLVAILAVIVCLVPHQFRSILPERMLEARRRWG